MSDDGSGFQPSTARRGLGLQNMQDRLGALDGHLTLAARAEGGTTLTGSVPLEADRSASSELDPP